MCEILSIHQFYNPSWQLCGLSLWTVSQYCLIWFQIVTQYKRMGFVGFSGFIDCYSIWSSILVSQSLWVQAVQSVTWFKTVGSIPFWRCLHCSLTSGHINTDDMIVSPCYPMMYCMCGSQLGMMLTSCSHGSSTEMFGILTQYHHQSFGFLSPSSTPLNVLMQVRLLENYPPTTHTWEMLIYTMWYLLGSWYNVWKC